MRRNGHRHTLARLGWRKTAGAFAIGLAGVVAVTLVSLAFGSSRDASSGQTFWAVTTDSSLLRFVLGTSSVSVSVTDSCVAGELNSGTASLQDDHFLFKGGPDSSSGRDLDTVRASVMRSSKGATLEILGTLTVNQHTPEVEGKQGSADTCKLSDKPFAAMPVQLPPASVRPLRILAGNTTHDKAKCTIGNNDGATGTCQGTPAHELGFTNPLGLAVSPAGNLYFTDDEDAVDDHDENTFGDYIQEVTAAGVAHSVPGAGDLFNPTGIVMNSAGDLYVAESGKLSFLNANAVSSSVGGEIVKITPSGHDVVIAGDYVPCGRPPACGDGGPASKAQLTVPSGLAIDRAGDLYLADSGDSEVREISPSGIITASPVTAPGAKICCTAATADQRGRRSSICRRASRSTPPETCSSPRAATSRSKRSPLRARSSVSPAMIRPASPTCLSPATAETGGLRPVLSSCRKSRMSTGTVSLIPLSARTPRTTTATSATCRRSRSPSTAPATSTSLTATRSAA